MSSRFVGDLRVTGLLSSTRLNIPTGSVTNNSVSGGAAIDVSKLKHQRRLVYGQSGTVSAETIPFFGGTASGEIVNLRAALETEPGTSDSVTIDLHKNGSSVLVSTLSIDDTATAYEFFEATIDSSGTSDGDFFELVVTVSGTTSSGLLVEMFIDEDSV